MFTGLIEHVGVVVQARTVPKGRELRIDLGPLAEGLEAGESLAVDGVCLTAACVHGSQADFDVTATTLDTTTLGGFGPSRRVNLERPITLQDRLGGHLVAGHVDGLATLGRWSASGQGKIGFFHAPKSITDFMISKGSVALNGVSLTIAELQDSSFSIALIPQTLARTNLGELQPGQSVNVETDLIGKYIAKFIAANPAQPLTLETLKEHGFA
ncbi:MAG: riboflavin synthase [Phycisphaerae bacterium]|nr:riboflavin synthase [Phycisphaerae bacterium]